MLRVIIVGLVGSSIIVGLSYQNLYAQETEKLFPLWFNQNLRWFLDDKIGEQELALGFKFLVDENIIFLDPSRAQEVNDLREENNRLKKLLETKQEKTVIPSSDPISLTPELCPNVYNPICGEDGKTYDNACKAKLEDVEVRHEGECLKLVACPTIYAPVCGDDEKTYDNVCLAEQLEINVAYSGECTKQNIQCPDGYFWLSHASFCLPVSIEFVCPNQYSWNEQESKCVPES